jgi:ribosome-associated protein
LSKQGFEPNHREGYDRGDWILLDYVDFVVHIFNENARKFYDLERLWKSAKKLEPGEVLGKKKPARAAVRTVAAKPAKRALKKVVRKAAPKVPRKAVARRPTKARGKKK